MGQDSTSSPNEKPTEKIKPDVIEKKVKKFKIEDIKPQEKPQEKPEEEEVGTDFTELKDRYSKACDDLIMKAAEKLGIENGPGEEYNDLRTVIKNDGDNGNDMSQEDKDRSEFLRKVVPDVLKVKSVLYNPAEAQNYKRIQKNMEDIARNLGYNLEIVDYDYIFSLFCAKIFKNLGIEDLPEKIYGEKPENCADYVINKAHIRIFKNEE